MSTFYPFNQRVYLRRDPSQFGRIGTTSPSGAVYDWETQTQPVFWEHEGADIVTVEHVEDLMSEEELCERRRLFIATMRKPEMRLLRAALWDLKWEHGVPWETITSLEMERYGSNNDCWFMRTDHHLSVCLSINDEHPHFLVLRLHDANDPLCECDDCQDARRFADGAFMHVENAEGKRLV